MIEPTTAKFIGSGLQRPECVLCTEAGNIYAADQRGGISMIDRHGCQSLFIARDSSFNLQPNGLALLKDGSFLIAHLGNESGGVYRLTRDGILSPFLLEIDGQPLPPTNYVHLDIQGRVWITISTRLQPRSLSFRPDACDGFIILVENNKARIVADNLGFTNECQVHPTGQWLYVNETFSRKLSRFIIEDNGDLSGKQTVAEFGAGVYPDGLAFDSADGVWVTSIISNRVIRINAYGGQEIIMEDCDMDYVERVERAFLAGRLNKTHFDNGKSKVLRNISSLAFGGDDLGTIYLGCLSGNSIATFKAPVSGAAPTHWTFDN